MAWPNAIPGTAPIAAAVPIAEPPLNSNIGRPSAAHPATAPAAQAGELRAAHLAAAAIPDIRPAHPRAMPDSIALQARATASAKAQQSRQHHAAVFHAIQTAHRQTSTATNSSTQLHATIDKQASTAQAGHRNGLGAPEQARKAAQKPRMTARVRLGGRRLADSP